MNTETLRVERFGNGFPIIFLHGWGMHRVLLRQFAMALAEHYEIILVDLPGHGNSDMYSNAADIKAYASYLNDMLPMQPAFMLCGWSMGAMLAMQLAHDYPSRVKQLILFTATPCFTCREDWNAGVELPALQQVGVEMSQDYHKAMLRFLSLQLKNLPDARGWIRHVRELLVHEPEPQLLTLQQGLTLLAGSDLRSIAPKLSCPTLIINGDRDSLVPTAAARWLVEHLPDARAMLLHGSGHLPFVTHQARCLTAVMEFLNE